LGAGQVTVNLDVIDDNLVEGDENVRWNITPNLNYTIDPGNPFAEIALVDDDAGVITVTPLTPEGNEEGSAVARFRLTLSNPNDSGAATTVAFTIAGTAIDGTDYNRTGSFVFPSNGTTVARNINITPIDDALTEGTETVTLTLTGTNNTLFTIGGADEATVSILDNDYTATIIAADADAAENTPANATGIFTVDLGNVNNTGAPIVVNFTRAGTATHVTDYANIGLTVNVPNGDQSANVNIVPVDDALIEAPETVILNLGTGTAYNLAAASTRTATINIVDNDAAGFTITETGGNTATSEPDVADTFSMVLTSQPASNVILNLVSSDTGEGTVAPATVTFTPANYNVAQEITITGADDVLVDGVQPYSITVSVDDAGSDDAFDGLPDQTINATNADDDSYTASIVATSATAEEGNPATEGTFTVDIGTPNTSGTPITVNFTIAGTATNITDYTDIGTSIAIADGDQTAEITITPTNDLLVEGAETVVLTLAAGTGYDLGAITTRTATVNILDDDVFEASISATDPDAAENTPANAVGTFTIRLDAVNNTGNPVIVNFTAGGTATNVVDYGDIGSSVSIADGSQTAAITIRPVDDTIVEGQESVTITLDSGTSYIVAASPDNSDNVNIADDDNLTATITATDASAAENTPATSTGLFTIDLGAPNTSGGPITVNYTIATGAGNAVNGTDYTTIGTSLTIPAGQQTGTISIVPTDDEIQEVSEAVTLTLTTGTNYVLGAAPTQTATVDIGDDDRGSLSISNVAVNENNAAGNLEFDVVLDIAVDGGTTVTYNFSDDTATGGGVDYNSPILDATVTTVFCDVIDVSLNDYTSSAAPAGTELRWSTLSDPLNENAYLTPAQVANPPNDGSYFGFFLDDNGTPNNFDDDCASGTIEVELTLNTTPTLISVTNNERCDTGTVLLSAVASDGASINWYNVPTGGTVLAIGADFTTPPLSGTTSFYAEAVENGCATERQEVIATVGFQATVGVATNASACSVAANDKR